MATERRGTMSRGKTVLFSAVTVAVVFAILEGAARLVQPAPDPGLYETHREMIRVLGLPEMNRLMRFDGDRFWALRENLRGERIAGRIRDEAIDFRVSTDDRGMRRNGGGAAGGGEALSILAVGNSCTFGVGVEDGETWPARLERILREERGVEARVRNAGVPGYTAFQGLRLLRGGALDPPPDLVIACFGFNDVDAWGPHGDRETARALAKRRAARLLDGSGLVRLLRGLFHRGGGGEEGDGERRPRLTPEEFGDTVLEMNRVCAKREVPLLLLVWPFRRQVEGDAPARVAYQPILDRAGAEARIPVIDLVPSFRAAGEGLFIDHIHASPSGCEVAARAIDEAMNRARTR